MVVDGVVRPVYACIIVAFLMVICVLQDIRGVDAHGCMSTPNQRGTLSGPGRSGAGRCSKRIIDINAPIDYKAHFPAGPKVMRSGVGLRYQQSRAGRFGWVPFTPLISSFRWRAGVCGDQVGRREAHRRGGKYYYGGTIAGRYPRGSVIKLGLTVNAHHNGFMELHLCDVRRCGGEISESCFRRGHCMQLRRAPNSGCDSGYHRYCGPIDRYYPGRWYLPCSSHPVNNPRQDRWGVGGQGAIEYILPQFKCKHCVLQWFWTAANTCNPPGVYEYFTGPDRPRWGRCKGQGGARGGFVNSRRPCGGRRFPEEYLQCADIEIY